MTDPFVPSTTAPVDENFVPFDRRSAYVWVDGEIIPNTDVKFHFLTHGLHYAGSVFEGVRIYNGHILALEEHTKRLLEGVAMHKFSIPFTADEINQGCRDLIKKLGLTDGYMRPIAFLGSEDTFVQGLRCTPHFAIAAYDLEVPPSELTLKTSSRRRAGADALMVHSKCSEVFATGRIGKTEAAEAGYNEALFLDQQGFLADSTAANVFLVIDGELHTPDPVNILPGITQKIILKRAAVFGYKVNVRKIKPEEIARASEAFMCGTAMEVHQIIKIDDIDIPKGPISAQIIDDYNALVRKPNAEVDRILGLTNGLGL